MKLSLKISLAIGLIALVIVPAIGFLSFSIAGGIIKERLENEQGTLARSVLHEIDLRLHKGWEDIYLLSQVTLLRQDTEEILPTEGGQKGAAPLTQFLKEKLPLTGPWDLLMVVGREGEIVASTVGFPFGKGIDDYPLNREAFYSAMSGATVATDVMTSKITSRPTLAFAAPIFDAKKEAILGVVIGQMAWPVVMEVLDGLAPHYEVLLTNQKGEIIATRTRDRKAIWQNIAREHPLFSQTALKKRGTFFETYTHPGKGKYLSSLAIQEGYLKYRGHQWRLFLEVPESLVFAPIKVMARNIALAVGLLLAFLTVAVYFAVHRITRPIEQLGKSMAAVGEGDLSQRARVSTKDEVGGLAENFNQMIEDLQKSQEAYIQSIHYIDNIIRSIADALIVIHSNGTIRTVNQATLDLSGYSEEELKGGPIGKIIAAAAAAAAMPFSGTGLEKLIAEGFVRHDDLLFKTKHGEEIPVSVSGAVMHADPDDGRTSIIGVVIIAKDMREIHRLMGQERQKTQELEEKTARLEDFQDLVVGRELDMLKLKGEINALLEELGKPIKYEEGEMT